MAERLFSWTISRSPSSFRRSVRALNTRRLARGFASQQAFDLSADDIHCPIDKGIDEGLGLVTLVLRDPGKQRLLGEHGGAQKRSNRSCGRIWVKR